MIQPPDALVARLDELTTQFEAVSAQLLDPEVMADHTQIRSLSIRRAALEPIVEAWSAWRSICDEITDLEEAVSGGDDQELAALANDEIPGLRARADTLIESVQQRLVRSDDDAVGALIMEIRPGVGGDEAALWAGDLVDMYRHFATRRKWKVEDLELTHSEYGGLKLAILSISGHGAWAHLGYEGGTHQVKRVPATEAQGRVHTSTATVAVLPEPEEVEVDLDPGDVKEMITTSQGPGGQNVNKVATAVHLIHEPSGVEVRMQDTKSQAQNREKAWKLLRARLFEQQQAKANQERREARRTMIGSGNRAEKIRTYRYKDNLLVDHRLGESFNLETMLSGDLDRLVDALIELDTAQRLASL